jgi:Pyruvate/2-oxoacid:ferredoxin oxidoreductase delta subunit
VQNRRGEYSDKLIAVTLTVAVAFVVAIIVFCQPASCCYGPQITANVSATEIYINEEVTVTGKICLGGEPFENLTVRVVFIKPDYTFVDVMVQADNDTGEFTATHTLTDAGFWNIFPVYGHINDRLSVNVIDPSTPYVDPETAVNSPFHVNLPLIGGAATAIGFGAVMMVTGRNKKTRKISSFRVFVQIGLVFLIFGGMFIDHEILPRPANQIPVHEFLVATDVFGVSMVDGFPVPFFGCYYPCGKTVTCALWEIQTYFYPFWNTSHGWGVDYNASGLVRLAIVFGVLILASLLLGKVFCGWICPFGLYMDLLTYLRKALKIPHRNFSEGFSKKFHQLGYVILALIIVLSVIFGSEAIVGAQLVPGTEQGGFVNQYFSAPFCQVCPMKPLCILLEMSVGLIRPDWIGQVTTGTFYELGFYLTSLNLIVLGIVTVAAFFYRRLWCRICPLGALVALFNRFPPFKRFSLLRLDKVEEKCTKCGICKRVCPTQVTEIYEEKGGDVTTSSCIMCLRCVEMCPYEDALRLQAAGKTIVKSRNWLN